MIGCLIDNYFDVSIFIDTMFLFYKCLNNTHLCFLFVTVSNMN